MKYIVKNKAVGSEVQASTLDEVVDILDVAARTMDFVRRLAVERGEMSIEDSVKSHHFEVQVVNDDGTYRDLTPAEKAAITDRAITSHCRSVNFGLATKAPSIRPPAPHPASVRRHTGMAMQKQRFSVWFSPDGNVTIDGAARRLNKVGDTLSVLICDDKDRSVGHAMFRMEMAPTSGREVLLLGWSKCHKIEPEFKAEQGLKIASARANAGVILRRGSAQVPHDYKPLLYNLAIGMCEFARVDRCFIYGNFGTWAPLRNGDCHGNCAMLTRCVLNVNGMSITNPPIGRAISDVHAVRMLLGRDVKSLWQYAGLPLSQWTDEKPESVLDSELPAEATDEQWALGEESVEAEDGAACSD